MKKLLALILTLVMALSFVGCAKQPADTDAPAQTDYEYVKEKGTLVVGITDFAQRELGDIVFVECETVGDSLEAGETFGTVEAVKTVSDLYLPVAGEVLEFNEELEVEPELVNKDPYGKGWI